MPSPMLGRGARAGVERVGTAIPWSRSSPASSPAARAVSEQRRSGAASPGQVFGVADEQGGSVCSFYYLKCSVDTSWCI